MKFDLFLAAWVMKIILLLYGDISYISCIWSECTCWQQLIVGDLWQWNRVRTSQHRHSIVQTYYNISNSSRLTPIILADCIEENYTLSKGILSANKILVPHRYASYHNKITSIVFAIVHAVKGSKFHLARTIDTEVLLFVYVIYSATRNHYQQCGSVEK